MPLPRFGTIGIAGVGLIGGSIGLALKQRGLAGRVVGLGRDRARLETARSLGAIDVGVTEPGNELAEAELIVVCTPVSRIVEDLTLLAESTGPGTLLTDAGSTKRKIVEAAEACPALARKFIGSHPIAGSEKPGVEHADANLFQNRVCALTPTGRTPAELTGRAREFWGALGMRIVEIDPVQHDDALALTSHLPHAVASALADIVPMDWHDLAAGAFRDVTRVAAADPALWTAIFLENRGPTLDALGLYEERLASFRRALEASDPAALDALWASGKTRRERFRPS